MRVEPTGPEGPGWVQAGEQVGAGANTSPGVMRALQVVSPCSGLEAEEGDPHCRGGQTRCLLGSRKWGD